ncbi:MAG TPA: lysine--tRNA ligase [Patescibacteria group bacterium]|nr:lysine--tRNA ligase [Patescibacteria group bacterium]
MSQINKLVKTRREKLDALRLKGINPFPNTSGRQQSIAEARNMMNKEVVVAGRILSKRGHGNLVFVDIVDESEKIQLLVSKSVAGEEIMELLELTDIGDFVEASGKIIKTVAGEISVQVSSLTILSKSLSPLPSTWFGFKDVEERYRKRYVDFLMNKDSKNIISTRSKIVSEVRKFLENKGFMEVETPTMQPLYGGANARPFKTYYNALKRDFFLKISDELYLKRLIIGGFEKVFEIDHNFRNEGIDSTHNPEFTMMECYWAYADYNDIMKLTEDMYSEISKKVLGSTKVKYLGHEIDLKAPWERLTMKDAIKKYLNIDLDEMSDEKLKEELISRKLEVGERDGAFNRGLSVSSLFEDVEEKLIQPVFITDFPKETTSLCKLHRHDDGLIERFEPYIAGKEIGNAYTELNDPDLQRHFFEEEVKAKDAGAGETHPLDEDFLTAMEYGMPPTGGLGLGIDRMIMIMTGTDSIRDVIAFPTLKTKVSSSSKKSDFS